MTVASVVELAPSPSTGPEIAIWCCGFELSGSGGPSSEVVPVPGQRHARALVRIHGEPLGYLTVERGPDGIDVPGLVAASWQQFGSKIGAHLADEAVAAVAGSRPPAPTAHCPNHVESEETVTVVVCTRNRAVMLDRCLGALQALTYPYLDFLVVDNAPSDDSTRRVVERFAAADPRFAYVVEPLPGLSRARNRGLVTAGGRYLAYTDDDVSVDPLWIEGLIRGFQRRPDVACVTGLACSAGITSPAEVYFDARAASWSKRCDPDLFELPSPVDRGPLYPYSAGIFGTGANFAFDRGVVLGLGSFDEALGAGTPTRGGEDLDIFVRVLRAGGAIAYEPAALVWHHHRADDASLLQQMYGYGTGLSAFMLKLLIQRATRADVLRRIPGGLARMVHIGAETRTRMEAPVAPPHGALRRELTGFVSGPVLYAKARRMRRPS